MRRLSARPPLADDGAVSPLLAHRGAPRGCELALGSPYRCASSGRDNSTICPKLSVKIGSPLSRKEKGFDIYEGVSIMGQQLKMSATDSSAGCQMICRNTPGCAAATYNDFFRGKNVACLVYRDVTGTMKAPTSTLMIRND